MSSTPATARARRSSGCSRVQYRRQKRRMPISVWLAAGSVHTTFRLGWRPAARGQRSWRLRTSRRAYGSTASTIRPSRGRSLTSCHRAWGDLSDYNSWRRGSTESVFIEWDRNLIWLDANDGTYCLSSPALGKPVLEPRPVSEWSVPHVNRGHDGPRRRRGVRRSKRTASHK